MTMIEEMLISTILDVGPVIIEETIQDNEEYYETFVDTDPNEPLQIDNIKNTIIFPVAEQNAINEFKYNGYATLIFPKLFLNGAANSKSKKKYLKFKYLPSHIISLKINI